MEGRLISTYYYGLVTMSIPGGVFADLIGPFKSIIASNILSAIATALAVPLASDNWLPLFLCRFIVGLCGVGIIFLRRVHNVFFRKGHYRGLRG